MLDQSRGARRRGEPWALLLLCLLGCAAPLPGRSGASIALIGGGAQVAVVNPDQGSISLLDPGTLAQRATVAVGGQPRALLELESGTLLVSTYRGGEVVAVDPRAARVVGRRQVCAGPYGLAQAPDRSFVALACEWDGTVLRLDPGSLAAVTIASGLRRPRAVAILGGDVYVAEFTGGAVRRVRPDGSATSASLVPAQAPYRPALTLMDASQAAALVPAFGGLAAAHLLVRHTGDLTSELEAQDYGTVPMDGNPKINPAVTVLAADLAPTAAPVVYARFDGGPGMCNGPVALAPVGSHHLLVAHQSSANVALLDLSAGTPQGRFAGSFTVGAGPAGIAVDQGRQVAYVDNALDGSVSLLDLGLVLGQGAQGAQQAPDLTLVRPLPAVYSAAALDGRRLFHDATNPHVTPAGVVACSTCHPDGGDDGLVWFIHTGAIPLKRRRTPHLANARTGARLLHWDGQFNSMSDLAQATITGLMAGDGLLVDFGSLQPFVDEIVRAPLLPPADPAAVARGQEVFAAQEVGCQGCHQPPGFFDNAQHAPLDPMSLRSDDAISAAKTPGLLGVFLRAPYFHDGRASDLPDLLHRTDASGHGHPGALSAEQQDDLIAYLRSL